MPSPSDFIYTREVTVQRRGNSRSFGFDCAYYPDEHVRLENDPQVFECTYCGNLYGKQPLNCPTCGGHKSYVKHMSDFIV